MGHPLKKEQVWFLQDPPALLLLRGGKPSHEEANVSKQEAFFPGKT